MTTIRQERVSGLLFQELSVMISSELEDPRLTMISVTEVAVSRDLRSVRVFIHQADSDLPKRDLLAGLQSATPYMRRQLAQRCGLRVVPELNFVYDDTPARAARVDELLQQIAAERQEHEQTLDSASNSDIDSDAPSTPPDDADTISA
ncbi:MAG: 30S ribosome-binding factor RbfA [Caldilineaceae bacterium]|nr:30S ribosome-binding factor RbfA [Caldilineaceae bacterium]MBP8110641.1 30S ribosome-binding factor RbfA [Caldilineaceae bacterium]MBP8125794.1 30S ribosome-binding factor RbfA [Caldilineaceae bacterium]MBP9075167.1 30S ribosome-binding factor RbfA [Caldilineaceae bacterium]